MKKVLHILLTCTLAFLLIFCFTACSNTDYSEQIKDLQDKIAGLEDEISGLESSNSGLLEKLAELKTLKDKITALESADESTQNEIKTLQTKITALETANALYQTQITALTTELETLKTTYADDKTALEAAIKANSDAAAELKTELDSLTESVVNATHIERIVVNAENFVEYQHPIVRTVYIDAYKPEPTQTPYNIQIGCMLGHDDYSFNYQLITFKTTLYINNQPFKKYNISVTQAKSGEYTVSQTFNTGIVYDNSLTDVYTATWSEIVLYRFV